MIRSYPYEIVDNTIKLKFPEITSDDQLPSVSVLTITRNRSDFYPLLVRNIRTCDFPKHLMEWIFVEDGSSRFDETNYYKSIASLVRVKYVYLGDLHFPIGYKRNVAVKHSSHDILVHLDDDDYYPPESVLARVRCLIGGIENLSCVGCLSVRTFNLFTEKTYEAYESSDINMSESSLAYKREFWNERSFVNKCSNAEGINFLKNRYEKCMSIPHVFVIVQFDHNKNTVIRKNDETFYTNESVNFLNTINNSDVKFIQDLRTSIVTNMPETKELVSFIKKNNNSMHAASKHLHTLPFELQRHPLALEICRTYPKLERTKNKRTVVFYCGSGNYMSFYKQWDYDNTDNIGGSEEAVLLLAKEWSRHCFVKIYNERDDTKIYENGRIIFYPWYKFCPLEKIYIFVSWRDPSHFTIFPSINSRYNVLNLHDFIPSTWIKKDNRIDFIFVKSQFHSMNCVEDSIDAHICIIPNGISVDRNIKTKEKIIICTSSPERCWVKFFRLAKDINEIDSSYTFIHAYSYSHLRSSKHWTILKTLYETNEYVNLLGHLSIKETNELYERAYMFVYPTLFPEIDCVSLTKAINSSCVCIHTSAGAMMEKSKIYDTVCIPVRDIHSYDECSVLNDEEYDNFKNAVLENLSNSTETPNKKVKSIEEVFQTWHETIN